MIPISKSKLKSAPNNTSPQHPQYNEVAVLAVDASAAQFNHFGAQRLEDSKLEFLRTIITEIFLGVHAGLQAIGANDLL